MQVRACFANTQSTEILHSHTRTHLIRNEHRMLSERALQLVQQQLHAVVAEHGGVVRVAVSAC
jgi:hypothetical protein